MPFAIVLGLPWVPIIAALAVLLIAAAFESIIIGPLAAIMARVPVVGGKIAGAITAAGDAAVGFVTRPLQASYNMLKAILLAPAMALEAFSIQTASFAGTLADGLSYLRRITIPAIAHAVGDPIARGLARAVAAADIALGWTQRTVANLGQGIVDLTKFTATVIAVPLAQLLHVTIPAINHHLAALGGTIAAELRPRIGNLEESAVRAARQTAALALGLTAALAITRQINLGCHKKTCANIDRLIDLADDASGAILMQQIMRKAGISQTDALRALDGGLGALAGTL